MTRRHHEASHCRVGCITDVLDCSFFAKHCSKEFWRRSAHGKRLRCTALCGSALELTL